MSLIADIQTARSLLEQDPSLAGVRDLLGAIGNDTDATWRLIGSAGGGDPLLGSAVAALNACVYTVLHDADIVPAGMVHDTYTLLAEVERMLAERIDALPIEDWHR